MDDELKVILEELLAVEPVGEETCIYCEEYWEMHGPDYKIEIEHKAACPVRRLREYLIKEVT